MKPPELRDMGAKTKPRAQTAQKRIPESILILADIEGSSGCHTREAARFMGKGWPQACLDMTLDLNAVVEALFNSGVGRIHIQDFHRTGYNIIPRLVHDNATLSQGYRQGHVPGMGNVRPFQGLIMLGMHAPSGSRGFLPHTLTSRIANITIKNDLISEAQLFGAALAPIPFFFFSGCPVACNHTRKFIPGVSCFEIDKKKPGFNPSAWRKQLANAAVMAVQKSPGRPYAPKGPFQVIVTMAQKKEALSIGKHWKINRKGANLLFETDNFPTLFWTLSRLAYLRPWSERLLFLGLPLYHLMGRAGLAWVKKKAPALDKNQG